MDDIQNYLESKHGGIKRGESELYDAPYPIYQRTSHSLRVERQCSSWTVVGTALRVSEVERGSISYTTSERATESAMDLSLIIHFTFACSLQAVVSFDKAGGRMTECIGRR